MPAVSTIQTIALSIFGFLITAIIAAVISANVRRWAAAKGHDAYLLQAWEMFPDWGHKLFSGWRPLREQWWVWLCLGLSGGLGAALWILSNTPMEMKTHPESPPSQKTSSGPTPTPAPQPAPPPTPTEREFVGDLNFDALIARTKGLNGIEAGRVFAPYIGKWILVSGTIDMIIPAGNTGDIIVQFQAQTKNAGYPYMTFNRSKWVDRLGAMTKGDTLTAACMIGLVQLPGMSLNDCEVQ